MSLKNIANEPFGRLIQSDYHNVPWYHFSVDDVFDSLIEVTSKDIPLFEHPFFSLLKEINISYGAQIDLELFYEKDIDGRVFTLNDVRDLSQELKSEGNWLRFAPHAHSYNIAPFEQTPAEQIEVFDAIYTEIDRFAGREFYSIWVRLHYYSESYELASYFKSKGVTALFSTDREVGSHRAPLAVAESLLENGFANHEGMNFIRTQYRVEVFTNQRISEAEIEEMFLEALQKFGYIIFYSHEYEFARSEVRVMFRKMFEVLDRMQVKSIKYKNLT